MSNYNRVKYMLLNNINNYAKIKQLFIQSRKIVSNNNSIYTNSKRRRNQSNHNKISTRKITTSNSSYGSNSKPPNLDPKLIYIALLCGSFVSFTKKEK